MKTGYFYRITSHIKKSWKHHASLQAATLVVLIASFTVITGVLTISQNFYRILTLWGESMQMSVYIQETASPDQVSGIERYLKENNKVSKVQLVNKEQALDQFKEQMASYAPDILNDKDLLRFIPSSFQFSLSRDVAPKDQLTTMKNLAANLVTVPGVEEVSYGQDWVRSYSAIITTLTGVGGLFVIIILVSAAFVMSNSIHSSIQQRRNEIEVMELIGATRSHIRWPFIWEGAFLGTVSSVLAITFGYGLFSSIKNYLHGQIAFLQLANHIEFISTPLLMAVIIFAILAGGLASFLCVKRINHGWAASSSRQVGEQ